MARPATTWSCHCLVPTSVSQIPGSLPTACLLRGLYVCPEEEPRAVPTTQVPRASHPSRHRSSCATSNTHCHVSGSVRPCRVDRNKRAHLSPPEGFWVNREDIHKHTLGFLTKCRQRSPPQERSNNVLKHEGRRHCLRLRALECFLKKVGCEHGSQGRLMASEDT